MGTSSKTYGVKVSGTVLHDLDALAQRLCSEIEALVGAAIDRLALDVVSLSEARDLLLMVQADAMRLVAARQQRGRGSRLQLCRPCAAVSSAAADCKNFRKNLTSTKCKN